MNRTFSFFAFTFLLLGTGHAVQAQTTAGIPGPGVSEDDRTVQLRTAFAPGEDGRADRWEARIHYQQGITDDLRWRIVAQGNDFEGGFESVFLQGELQWEIDENPDWAKALRFDVRIAENDDGADQIGLQSFNQFRLGDRTYARGNIFTGLQVGSRRASGLAVEFRGQLGYKANDRTTLVLETFNPLGRGTGFGKLNENAQRAGPGVNYKLGNGTSVMGSILFGLNDVAADTDLRLWLTKSFG